MELFALSKKGKRFTAAATSTVCDLAEGNSPATNLLITNLGTVPIFVISGKPSTPPTADNTCVPIPAGQSRAVVKPSTHTHLYAIAASGTADFVVNSAGAGTGY